MSENSRPNGKDYVKKKINKPLYLLESNLS